MPGGSRIVDANGWDASVGYAVDWAPSMRMVVDLSNLDASTWVNQTGESGHAIDAHYADQIDAWVSGRQYPWPFSERAVREAPPNPDALPSSGVPPPPVPRPSGRAAEQSGSVAARSSAGAGRGEPAGAVDGEDTVDALVTVGRGSAASASSPG